MKHLIVFSHPNPKSFNRAIVDTYAQALKDKGHEVRIRDLYRMKFDPVLKKTEMANFKKNYYPDDIKAEHDNIRWADIITLVFPIWWGGPPAVMKGYLERVLSEGFAYTDGPKGLLSDKKVFTISTLDAPHEVYEKNGIYASMNKILDDVTYQFAAIKGIGHKYFASVSVVSDEERRKMLEEVKKIAETIG